jgi:tetratricopeptide (TPR) repeat protein
MSDELANLLNQCTVRLDVDNVRGTGCFVSSGLILTCAHVVSSAKSGKVQVSWQGKQYSAAISRSLESLDVALLTLEGSVPDHPCVYLDGEVDLHDNLYSFGYTEGYPGGESATLEFEGWAELEFEGHTLLKLKEGQTVPGMSGAPLLNERTGAVPGIIRISRGRSSDLGARAIPTREIFEKWPDLKDKQEAFHARNTRWSELRPQPSITPVEKPSIEEDLSPSSKAFDLHKRGSSSYNQGQYEEALNYYQQALVITREVGDRTGEGTTLNNIGAAYQARGQYDQALQNYQQALVIHREVGNRVMEGTILNNIGLVYQARGQYDQALENCQQALVIAREVGDRALEEAVLANIKSLSDN